ncbi:MAG TPA: choice-of-anchor D domain-containing protein [Terriglobia bacterium]|nr:choice-of-anchor D domain-containing protein [Terriglobia bacterium]
MNESLETAQLWVDTTSGSDSNPGTQQLPLKTIGAAAAIAVNNNWNGVGTQVNINPGTYREAVSIGTSRYVTSLPITFQATTNGTAIVSGADVWTGWNVYSGNSSIYTNTWPYAWGLCAPDASGYLQQDIILRREMIAVNGTVMTQVLSLNDVQAGTFYVDETHGTVYLWPPSGTNMSTATVEVATRSGLLSDAGLGNIVFRGLTFQYDNSCRGSTAVDIFNSASNVLFDSDTFNWNNAGGLNLSSATDFTVQNSTANHNGQLGLTAIQGKYGLWENNQTSYNNWRGAQGAYYTWGNGGAHFYQVHNGTVDGATAIFNQTHGLHWDTDNANITADSIFASGNLAPAVLIERSEGPISISSSQLCNGNAPTGSIIVNGVSVNNSEYVSLTGSTIYNGGNQITDAGVAGGYAVTNWETGQQYDLVTEYLTLMQDTIEGVGASQGVFQDVLGGTDWTSFTTTLISDYNTWWSASNSTPWSTPGSPFNINLDFAAWKLATLTDVHSSFQAPSIDPSTACAATPDAPDYWLTASAGSVTVRPTTAAVFTATVTAVGAFDGTVNLTSDGVSSIPGATASWSANSITDSGTATFTVNTTSATPAGSYPVVLIASSGSVVRTSTVSVIIDASVSVSPNSLSFGNQLVGTSSSVQKVTLTNNGTASLTGISIALTGTGQNQFTETNTCSTSLSKGASCTISVTFSPKQSGTQTSTLQITDSDATSPQTVSLTGTATEAAASVSASSLTFPAQVVDTTSSNQTVTLSNTGTATMTGISIQIYGNFAIASNTCSSSLGAGASCTVSVNFTPKSTGTLTGNLNFNNSGLPSFEQVTLTGTGVAPTATATPSSLTFASQEENTTSPAQTVTLTNTSSYTMTITSVKISGPFAETTTCGSTLAGGKSCTYSVTFTPLGSGTKSGTLTINDNAASNGNGQQKVTLSGTGST